MRTIDDIVVAIASTNDPERDWSRLADLAREIESHPKGIQALPSVFSLYERFPDSDFGVPGPLAHAVEKFYGLDYVRLLTESLRRRPTEQTLLLAQRALNAHDQYFVKIMEVVKSIPLRADVEPILRDEAARVLGRHS